MSTLSFRTGRPRRHLLQTVVWLLVSALPLGAAQAQTAPQELTVSAAASLTNAFQDIARAFEKAHPGSKLVLNFAASGPLLQQIRQGAPVDVFASADQETMDKAAAAQLLAPGRVDFAANTLVLVQPAAASANPKSLADLAAPAWRRLATGSPATVPVGRYTLEAVKAAGLEAELQPRWIYGDSVRQVLAYVARGEVDAGFVYRTDALIEKDKVRIAFSVPTRPPVSYPIAPVAASKNLALAQSFIGFVRSAPGQEILAGYGFARP